MPKPGSGKYNNHKPWKNQYSEHDYRGGETTRRVSFKTNKFVRKDNTKDWSATIRSHLEEEDIDMGQMGPSHGRFSNKKFIKKHGNRSGSPAPRKGDKRTLFESPTGWYRVMLPHGNKYDKEFICRSLVEIVSPLTFLPIAWKANGPYVLFFIDDFKVATKLNDANKDVECPDGFKLQIRVTSGSSNIEITPEIKDRMKLAMAKRYNAGTKALDLTRFHADPDLTDVFCALFKPYVMLSVIDIIADNIPELEALNLFENKLQLLQHLKSISKKLPNLKILHMGNNKVRDISALDAFMGLPVLDLVLDGNPLCDKFTDQATYISEVRKRFPKVIKLDGIDLPPPISFDVAEDSTLPKSQQTFLCNEEAQGIVRQFLEQYFVIFDGESRQSLLHAYHESAVLSMTMAYPYSQTQKNTSWLNWYNADNRNLMRVQDSERRLKLLKQGHLAVVAFLQEMPSTKHDMHSFTVDLTLFTPQMLLLSVSGVFRELRTGHKTPPLRSFYRTFVIVPAGSGFCIANETIHITNATDEQAKAAFKNPVPFQPTPATDVVVASTSTVSTVSPSLDDNAKQQMIQAMSEQSGMNLEWSQKCLEETTWDFQKAVLAFVEVQKRGGVPAEAFVK